MKSCIVTLFCAVNLWFVLARLAPRPPARLSLVFPETEPVKGLGAMAPGDLSALFAARRRLDGEAVDAGHAAWNAYTAPEPAAVERLLEADASLPFGAGAAGCHLGRLPSTRGGLNGMERAALSALREGPLAFAPLFTRTGADEAVGRLGAGDVQAAGMLRELAAGPAPMVVVARLEDAPSGWTVALTEAGRAVLAGDADRTACSPIDRWVGGIRLAPGHPAWRWDGRHARRAA